MHCMADIETTGTTCYPFYPDPEAMFHTAQANQADPAVEPTGTSRQPTQPQSKPTPNRITLTGAT